MQYFAYGCDRDGQNRQFIGPLSSWGKKAYDRESRCYSEVYIKKANKLYLKTMGVREMVKKMMGAILGICLLFSMTTVAFAEEGYAFDEISTAYSVLCGKVTEMSRGKIKLSKTSEHLWSENLAPKNSEYIILDTANFQEDELKKGDEIKVYFEYLMSDYAGQEENPEYAVKLLYYQKYGQKPTMADKTEFLQAIGILSGYKDGELHLDKNITRAEFTVLILKAYYEYGMNFPPKYNPEGKVPYPFQDVPEGHWAKNYIAYAYETGIIHGKSDTTFAPDESITIQDALVILLGAEAKGGYNRERFLERMNSLGGYPKGYVTNAWKYGLIEENSGEKIATRGDIVSILYNAYSHEVNVELIFVARKPVIYLYPERETDVNVKVNFGGAFTFTYPAYENEWNVTAKPNGDLLQNGVTYPYLFWEGNLQSYVPRLDEGFLVSREDTVAFLEDKLRIQGLNDKERADFITYWAPQLMKNEFNIIKFDSEAYTSAVSLNIDPQPDCVIRIFMVYQAANGKESIQEQELKPVERKGFTAVEWGGIGEE